MANRRCALCRASDDMRYMIKAGTDYLCADRAECHMRKMEQAEQLSSCEECGRPTVGDRCSECKAREDASSEVQV